MSMNQDNLQINNKKIANIIDANMWSHLVKEDLYKFFEKIENEKFVFTTSVLSEILHDGEMSGSARARKFKEFFVKLAEAGRLDMYNVDAPRNPKKPHEVHPIDKVKIVQINEQNQVNYINKLFRQGLSQNPRENAGDKDINYLIRTLLKDKIYEQINIHSSDTRLLYPYISVKNKSLIEENIEKTKSFLVFDEYMKSDSQKNPMYNHGATIIDEISKYLDFEKKRLPVEPYTLADTVARLHRDGTSHLDPETRDEIFSNFINKQLKPGTDVTSAQPEMHAHLLKNPNPVILKLGEETKPLVHKKDERLITVDGATKSETSRKRMLPLLLATGAATAAGGAVAMASTPPAEQDQPGIDIPVTRQPAATPPTEERGFFGRLWGGVTEEIGALVRDPRKTLTGYAQDFVTTIQPIVKPFQNLIDRPAENFQAFVDEVYEQGKYAVNNPLQTVRNAGGMAATTLTMVGDIAGLAVGAVNAFGRYTFDPNATFSDAMTAFENENNFFLRNTDLVRDEVRAFLGAEKPESIFGQSMEAIIQTVATLGMGAMVKGASKAARVGVDILTAGGASTPAGQQLAEAVGGVLVGGISAAGSDAPVNAGDRPASEPGSAPFEVARVPHKTGVTGPDATSPGVVEMGIAQESALQLQAMITAITSIDARLAALEAGVTTLQAGLPANIIHVVDATLAQRRTTQDYSQLRDALPSGQMRGVYNALQPTAGY